MLRGFVPPEAEDLLVGLAPADDAAVYRLDDERALIFTLDFFPPVVDDPGDYGAIAATNALNDVFAMGGTPLLALSIAAFPEELPVEMLGEIFAAAHVTTNGLSDTLAALGYDPQTAGGLLVSLPAEQGAALEAEFAGRKLFVRRIGRVEEGAGVVVE